MTGGLGYAWLASSTLRTARVPMPVEKLNGLGQGADIVAASREGRVLDPDRISK